MKLRRGAAAPAKPRKSLSPGPPRNAQLPHLRLRLEISQNGITSLSFTRRARRVDGPEKTVAQPSAQIMLERPEAASKL